MATKLDMKQRFDLMTEIQKRRDSIERGELSSADVARELAPMLGWPVTRHIVKDYASALGVTFIATAARGRKGVDTRGVRMAAEIDKRISAAVEPLQQEIRTLRQHIEKLYAELGIDPYKKLTKFL